MRLGHVRFGGARRCGPAATRVFERHARYGRQTDLMRQVVRICEEGGRILDPFAGSGTTLVAADAEGYAWTGIEMTQHYYDVASSRLGGH